MSFRSKARNDVANDRLLPTGENLLLQEYLVAIANARLQFLVCGCRCYSDNERNNYISTTTCVCVYVCACMRVCMCKHISNFQNNYPYIAYSLFFLLTKLTILKDMQMYTVFFIKINEFLDYLKKGGGQIKL